MVDELIHHLRDTFVALTSLARERPLWFWGGAGAVVLGVFVILQLLSGRGRGKR